MGVRPGHSRIRDRRRAALVTLLASMSLALPALAEAGFSDRSVDAIPTDRFFDLGAADYNEDGRIDLFTTNHKYRGALLRNNGGGSFTDVTRSTGLSPSPPFPGLEYLQPPNMSDVAVYIYVTDDRVKQPAVLHLVSNGAEAEGTLSFESDDVDVVRTRDATVRRGKTAAGRPQLDFDIGEEGVVEVSVNNIDLPTAVSIRGTLPGLPLPIEPPILQPDDIRVGTLGVRAESRNFRLSLRDRHGIAFADLGGGPASDAFIANGGLGGKIRLPGTKDRVQDEFFIADDGRFRLATQGTGLSKGGCRGRQSAAIDIDANGALDLFESCENDPPNIYLQKNRGEFKRIKPPRVRASTYRWVNLRGNKPALLAAERKGIRVITRGRRDWKNLQRSPATRGRVPSRASRSTTSTPTATPTSSPTRAAATRCCATSGASCERCDSARPVCRSPRWRRASSTTTMTASRICILVPQGLFRGTGGSRYRRTGQLKFGRRTGAAVTNWFDEDNDGLRDVVMAYSARQFARRATIRHRHNDGPGGHWLEVDLDGDGRNAQAIGARVSVKAGRRTQHQWVGQNDDSRFSQAHYRLYFGLGGRERIARLQVKWPDGAKTNLQDIAVDRVLRLQHP